MKSRGCPLVGAMLILTGALASSRADVPRVPVLVSGVPILAIRDPADPAPGTLPPAQQRLQEANKSQDYVLLPDKHGGEREPGAHSSVGREEEVQHLTLEWLQQRGLNP